MSDERHKYIEVIGAAPATSEGATADVQRTAFQAARQSAEALADEAGVRLGDVQHIAEIADEEETGRGTLRYRVRFAVEAKVERKGTGFRVD